MRGFLGARGTLAVRGRRGALGTGGGGEAHDDTIRMKSTKVQTLSAGARNTVVE